MASDQRISEFQKTLKGLDDIDEEKLLRRNLGDESLEREITPLLAEIRNIVDFASRYAQQVPDQHLEQVGGSVQNIVAQINAQVGRNNQEFIANKAGFINQLSAQLDNIRIYWPSFVAAAVYDRGLLEDQGIRQEYQKTLEKMQQQSAQYLEDLRKQSEEGVREARKLAEDIESRARRTAEKISVKEAQTQFEEAQKPLLIQLIVWGILSVGSFVAFFLIIESFLEVALDPNWTWQIVYYTGIRLAALTAVGSIAAYCMRILRSQLHLFQKNLHRRRVANCIEALVQAASTAEQRDFIYAQLVESITKFGDTGLLQGGDADDSGSRLTIDNITRSITSPKGD